MDDAMPINLKIREKLDYKAKFTLSKRFCRNECSWSRQNQRITDPMLGFKAFHSAEATLAGIELHRMLRKGQHQQSANMTIFDQFYSLAA